MSIERQTVPRGGNAGRGSRRTDDQARSHPIVTLALVSADNEPDDENVSEDSAPDAEEAKSGPISVPVYWP